ncbi:hypothetical protein M5K25_021427 [Dendrobium thyrsiflorum]|uniref:Uncharacterized protein n=1 Tax=Dendrobium thyrsiflorum TaxID=117978 RepID=A0ABD0UCK2_DENTH
MGAIIRGRCSVGSLGTWAPLTLVITTIRLSAYAAATLRPQAHSGAELERSEERSLNIGR